MNHFLRPYGRSLAVALAASVFVAAGQAQSPSRFSHLSFTAPPGWQSKPTGNWLTLVPQGLRAGQTAYIGISPGGETTRTLAEEFGLLVKASQGSFTTLKAPPATTGTDAQGLPTMTQTLALQDPSGAKFVRMYVGKKNGSRFEAMDFTASPDAVDAYFPAFKTFYGGLAYDGAPAPTAPPNDATAAPKDAPQPGEAGEKALQPGVALPVSAPQGTGVKISKNDKGIGAVAMAVGHDGTIHVAFVEALRPGTEDAVYYRSSSDGGRSWSEAKNLSEVMPGYMVGYCQIAVDASDRVYVVWRVAGEPNLQTEGITHTMNLSSNVVYRVRTGGAWNGSALNVNPPADHAHQDVGAGSYFAGADPSGKVHVAYVLNPDLFHPEYMFSKTQHQFTIRNGSVAQVDLDGTGHTAPREIFMAKVTDQGPYKACDNLDLLEGYFDAAGSAHFTAFATRSGEGDGANRIVLIEKGTQKPGIVLPGPGYDVWSPPPTLLLDAQGRRHIVAFFPAGENHNVRDYLLDSDAEPRVIRSASNVANSFIGFQACQGPGGQMVVLMEMNDTGQKGAGELYVSTSSGSGWSKPLAVTHNAGSGKSTYAATGPRGSVVTVTHWVPGLATAAFDKQGHLVLVHERDELSAFGSNAFGVTLASGDTAVPRLYFLRF